MIISVDSNNPQELLMTRGTALVACLGHTNEYIKQLKALIEISSWFAGALTILIISNGPLKNLKLRGGNEITVLGTPTFLLLHDGKEQARFLGETDTEKLAEFLQKNQISAYDTRNTFSQPSMLALAR